MLQELELEREWRAGQAEVLRGDLDRRRAPDMRADQGLGGEDIVTIWRCACAHKAGCLTPNPAAGQGHCPVRRTSALAGAARRKRPLHRGRHACVGGDNPSIAAEPAAEAAAAGALAAAGAEQTQRREIA